MTLVLDKFRSLLPPKTKTSPSGWMSFNAPCCHHRGHKADTRKRAGVRFDGNGIVYNCFNCKFSTGWQPGSPIGEKMKSLVRWLGASDDDIKDLVFEALKTESAEYKPEVYEPKVTFTKKELPEGAMPLAEWGNLLEGELEEKVGEDFKNVLRYLIGRGYENPFDYDFYWTPAPGYIDRVIVPFKWEGNIVGNTARKITDGKPKYVSDQHPFFVFNVDNQMPEQKYVLVCEGPFDALAVGGVALLTNEVSELQARIINSIGKQVIVIPDQDKAGTILIDQARELGWHVAFPNWGDGIKDCADAVKQYGKLFVVVDAIITATTNPAKIEIEKRRLLTELELQNV